MGTGTFKSKEALNFFPHLLFMHMTMIYSYLVPEYNLKITNIHNGCFSGSVSDLHFHGKRKGKNEKPTYN